jgi:hypothetical protein
MYLHYKIITINYFEKKTGKKTENVQPCQPLVNEECGDTPWDAILEKTGKRMGEPKIQGRNVRS